MYSIKDRKGIGSSGCGVDGFFEDLEGYVYWVVIGVYRGLT